jgi:hypothetical protein
MVEPQLFSDLCGLLFRRLCGLLFCRSWWEAGDAPPVQASTRNSEEPDLLTDPFYTPLGVSDQWVSPADLQKAGLDDLGKKWG